MHKISFFFYFLILSIFAGCDTSPNIDRAAIKEEKARRELKKVTEAEILNEATLIGQRFTGDAEKFLEQKSESILQENKDEPVRKADISWIHNLDSIESIYEAEIKYLSVITSENAELISPLEAELLDAYQYNIEKNISVTENIQKTEKEFLLYNKPIILKSSSCLRCHGKPEEEVTENILSSIKEQYPSSLVHGYSIGSIMGFWSVRLSQKKIIQEL